MNISIKIDRSLNSFLRGTYNPAYLAVEGLMDFLSVFPYMFGRGSNFVSYYVLFFTGKRLSQKYAPTDLLVAKGEDLFGKVGIVTSTTDKEKETCVEVFTAGEVKIYFADPAPNLTYVLGYPNLSLATPYVDTRQDCIHKTTYEVLPDYGEPTIQ